MPCRTLSSQERIHRRCRTGIPRRSSLWPLVVARSVHEANLLEYFSQSLPMVFRNSGTANDFIGGMAKFIDFIIVSAVVVKARLANNRSIKKYVQGLTEHFVCEIFLIGN